MDRKSIRESIVRSNFHFIDRILGERVGSQEERIEEEKIPYSVRELANILYIDDGDGRVKPRDDLVESFFFAAERIVAAGETVFSMDHLPNFLPLVPGEALGVSR